MAKTETTKQGVVGSLRRRCVLCDEFWVAKHPNDPNVFCPKCTDALRELIRKDK